MRITTLLLRCALAGLAVVSAAAQTGSSNEPLFTAIKSGQVGDVERLLARGADANATDADGVPALMAAALFGDAAMVTKLLEQRADANATGPGGTTALMWAVPNLEKVRVL